MKIKGIKMKNIILKTAFYALVCLIPISISAEVSSLELWNNGENLFISNKNMIPGKIISHIEMQDNKGKTKQNITIITRSSYGDDGELITETETIKENPEDRMPPSEMVFLNPDFLNGKSIFNFQISELDIHDGGSLKSIESKLCKEIRFSTEEASGIVYFDSENNSPVRIISDWKKDHDIPAHNADISYIFDEESITWYPAFSQFSFEVKVGFIKMGKILIKSYYHDYY